MRDVILRDLSGMAEFRLAEALQNDVWGHDDTADPADLMMVIQAEGGLCAGAFHGDRLIGYVFAFPTRDPQIQHSHRLAIRTEARGLGLGARLKWYQRDWCLARGIRLVRWTYDPLRILNASLNIGTLGAVGRTYYPDYYGKMAGINAGAPSDRLLAEWFVADATVTALANRQPVEVTPVSRIAIPTDFAEMLTADPDRALADRLKLRLEMTEAFARGEEITGFDRQRGEYLLTKRIERGANG
ncbi:GNAT family N-acetyltransferase [Tabrizicola sp. J26]|uniref:GNAT family N-acetyltransferase n=1 Tax=Alitabrizicola rongguiensis TaxID=2909234 RepID=UPI001F2204BE|nr:GNAT family N-acetyltransferase [Tabrizicola rongguiensis]MCF1710784.1 GNAT family N-acetyltransferase [Tabrizicola rongguiensis]